MDDIDDVPGRAAALFEHMAPGLPPPIAIRREPTLIQGMAAWGVRAQGGAAYRLKVALDASGAALIRRGGELLGLLTARGVSVPSSVAIRAPYPGSDIAVGLETRLGTTDARTAWRILGTQGRAGLAEDAAHGIWLLHRLTVADLGPWGVSGRSSRRPWREAVNGRIERQCARVRDSGRLPGDLIAEYEDRLLDHASRIPDDFERRPVHGAYALESIAVHRRAFAGIRDLERAGAGDPWEDVATFLVSTGDPGGLPTRRFLDTYAGHVPPPGDVETRLDLYEGLVLLRILVILSGAASDEEWAGFASAAEAYVGSEPLRWRW